MIIPLTYHWHLFIYIHLPLNRYDLKPSITCSTPAVYRWRSSQTCASHLQSKAISVGPWPLLWSAKLNSITWEEDLKTAWGVNRLGLREETLPTWKSQRRNRTNWTNHSKTFKNKVLGLGTCKESNSCWNHSDTTQSSSRETRTIFKRTVSLWPLRSMRSMCSPDKWWTCPIRRCYENGPDNMCGSVYQSERSWEYWW